ncbi:MAG: LysM peptidoglycan-binding domain-containing protein [Rubrimonas sp.]
MRGWLGAALAACAAGLAPSGAAAQEVACGVPHVIAPGETLHRIAVRAYGADGNFRTLFTANRARLGWRDPSQIEIGQVIAIPCPEGAPQPPLALLAAPRATGGADPDLAAEIAIAALAETRRGEDSVALTVLGPREAHLGGLLGPDLHRLSLPWPRPDCAAAATDHADPQTARLCSEFLWSRPLRARFDVAVAREGDAPGPEAPTCRAEDREQARACLDALRTGAAELAAMEAALLDAFAAEPGALDGLAELPGLTRETMLHAIAPIASPTAAADIARLDAGLAALEASGAALALRLSALAAQGSETTTP